VSETSLHGLYTTVTLCEFRRRIFDHSRRTFIPVWIVSCGYSL